MKIKKLFALMSMSTLSAMASAAVSADIQKSGQGMMAGLDKTATATGVASIFTLSAGPIPVTQRAREGDRKILALEDAYARKLGLVSPQAGEAAAIQVAMRSNSKTLDIEDGYCDVDAGF